MPRHVEALENRRLLSSGPHLTINPTATSNTFPARGVHIIGMLGDRYKGDVGILRDVTFLASDLSNLSATIDWGDSTVDTSSATFRRDHLDRVHVMGSHQFVESGKLTLSVNVSETINGASSSIAQFHGKAQVLEHGPGGTLVNPSATQEFTDSVADFHDTTHSNIRATIDWGDNSSDAGAVTNNGKGHYVVTGTHTYLAVSFYRIRVRLFSGTATTPFRVIKSVAQVRGFA